MLSVALAFTSSPYISLQVVTFIPIYTMEVNNSFGRIKKFNEKSCTISLREFKARYHFSNVVCELELKYGANYTKAFTFKQLAHYVHYEALNLHILK
jgi:hypothetical protein